VSASEVGPIWRSIRRHRAFALLVIEVALGFFIIGNLWMTTRWYMAKTLPGPGHRETDLVEIESRRPVTDGDRDGQRLADLRARERAALGGLPWARAVAAVSSTQLDDHWDMPTLYWSEPALPAGATACEGVERGADGVVAGWDTTAEPSLGDVLNLRVVAGTFFGPGNTASPDTVVVTRCLADALFGGAPALGRVLRSNRRPPARIVGVIEDVRMRVAFLYQNHVTAFYPLQPDDPRIARWVVRTQPGHAQEARAAAAPLLGHLDQGEHLVTARVFATDQTYSASVAWGTAVVLTVVGGLLGVLAILGNFAVAAFLVGERRRVIGVRRALGATRWDIFRYLVIENLLPTQLGNLAGLLILLATLPAAKARFSGIHFTPIDALGTAFLLSLGGVLAKLLPALRAARIPPSEVTRSL
jgi:putative ABC transport system permease protein